MNALSNSVLVGNHLTPCLSCALFPQTLESASKDLATVTGQRPVITRARKAIAGFKLRQGVPVGMATTLRGQVSAET